MSLITIIPVLVKSEDAPNQDMQACSGCLATRDLFDVREKGLDEIFKEVTGCEITQGYLCWVCLHMLHKFHAFRKRCHKAISVLRASPSVHADILDSTRKILENNFRTTEPLLINYTPWTDTDTDDTKFETIDNQLDIEVICNKQTNNINTNIYNETDLKVKIEKEFEDTLTDHDETFFENIIEVAPKEKHNKKRKLEKKTTKSNKKPRIEKKVSIVKKKCESLDERESNKNDAASDKVNDDEKLDRHELQLKIAQTFQGMWRGKSIEQIFQMLEKIHKEGIKFENCEKLNVKGLSKVDAKERKVIWKFLERNKRLSDLYNVDVEFVSVEEERRKIEEKSRTPNQKEGFCSLCTKNYNFAETYKRHMNRNHNESWQNVCMICQYRYKLKRHLVGHLLGNHARRFRCRECDIYIADLKWHNVKEHCESHRGVLIACKWCGKNFTAKKLYYMHLRAMHSLQIARAECLLCGDTFNGAEGLRLHHQVIHPQAVQCTRCKVWFCDSNIFDIHTGNDENCDTSHSYCGVCGDGFPSTELMREHYDQQHNQRKICPQCKRSFPSVAKFKAHKCSMLQTDSGRKRRTRQEKVKERDRERESNPYKYVCEYCGLNLTSPASLAIHIRKHTGEKPYQCDLCPKTFRLSNALEVHKMTHTGEKRYKCPHCERTFRQTSHVQYHILTHTLERPHACAVCGRQFALKGNLKAHMMTVHEGHPPRRRDKNNKQI